MKDHRRDHTVAIPQSTLEELAESQRKLAKRDTTLVGGAIVTEDPRTPEQSSSILCRMPREPIRRDELELVLAEHLKLFPVACQEAFLRSFSARAYVTAMGLLDEAIKLQPKNLSMAQAASAIRHFALARLESDLGGLHAKVRAVEALSTSELPRPLADMLLHIDGATSIEGLLRRAPGIRLQALGLLADLARDEQIELLLPSPQRNVSLRLQPMSVGSGARIDRAPRGGATAESGERKRAIPPRVESPPAALALPDELLRPVGDASKERLVTWSSSSETAAVSGPFAPVVRADAAPPEPPVVPSAPPEATAPAAVSVPPAETPIASARPRHSSAAPTSLVAEPRPVNRAGALTSRRWFIPAVVAASLGAGALLLTLFQAPTVPPPHPARPSAAPPPPAPTAAPTLLPPVPVAKPAPEASAAAADAGISGTLVFKIDAEPKYARVTLDGVLLTKAPIRVVIPKDGKEHEVRVESAGFHSKKLVFQADADVSMIVALDRAIVSPPKASAR